MSVEVTYKKNAYIPNVMTLRGTLLIVLDLVLINLAAVMALALRFDFKVPPVYMNTYIDHAISMTLIMFVVQYLCNLYRSLWEYASIEELFSVVLSSTMGMLLICVTFLFLQVNLPKSFYLLTSILNMTLVGGSRLSYRVLRRLKMMDTTAGGEYKRVLIIGAGKAGALMIREIKSNPQIKKIPVAVVDDDRAKLKKKIHGIPIMGTRMDIRKIAEEKKIDEIIIALPSAKKSEIREIVKLCKHTKCRLRTLPGVYELIDGQVDTKKIRDVNIEDLLGREPVKVDLVEISSYLTNEVILVTGGGGSIGSELCRQIVSYKPKQLLLLDIYENSTYEIQNELLRKHKNLDLKVFIASIRDRKRMEQIFNTYRPSVVFHAAAHKHVPLMEANPMEAIKNNIFGTLNVAELADKYNSKKFVLISTDKAVNPTNIMGATKRVAEMIVQALDKQSKTDYVAVRFGNVLGSNGSVIPVFKKQIAEGGPVMVTHPDIIRYFMTIPEAVQLVVQVGAMAHGGEIFVLDMGEPVKIVDLARDLIKLSGFEPEVDIKIQYTGLRPGEKLYEELLMAEEGLHCTRHEKIFVGASVFSDMEQLKSELSVLSMIIQEDSNELLEPVIKRLVPTYRKVS